MQLSRKLALATGGFTLVGLALGLPVKAEKTMVEDVTEVTETVDMPSAQVPDLMEAGAELQNEVMETIAPQPADVVESVTEPAAEAEVVAPEGEVSDLEPGDDVEAETMVDETIVEEEIVDEAVVEDVMVEEEAVTSPEEAATDLESAEEMDTEAGVEEAEVDLIEETDAATPVEAGKLEAETLLETPAIEAEITPIPGL